MLYVVEKQSEFEEWIPEETFGGEDAERRAAEFMKQDKADGAKRRITAIEEEE
jgi:hypothetical protein